MAGRGSDGVVEARLALNTAVGFWCSFNPHMLLWITLHYRQRCQTSVAVNCTQVITQDELKTNAAARDSLARALSALNPAASASGSATSPIFVGIGVTDPDVAAFLSQATSQLPTALFWNSAPSLSSSNRVDGFAPEAAGPLAKLLAQNVPFSREAKAAEVMKTLDVLWSRDTSGRCTATNIDSLQVLRT